MKPERKIRIGIAGYGNLGRGVEYAVKQNPDMELIAVFTRRPLEKLHCSLPVFHISDMKNFKDKIDVMILCWGSATDLPEHGAAAAEFFDTVDSFDTHAKIPEYFRKIDECARKNHTLSLISCGWDPGLFSLARLLGHCVLPEGKDYTFWGKGVSQGHSDAIRRVPGVRYGIQYTVPVQDVVEKIRNGEEPELKSSDMHLRICYVVPEKGADLKRIKETIINMPHYFKEYKTTVNFISEEEFKKNHTGMPHGGTVIRSGKSATGLKHRIEFTLNLESNPEFTASVLVAYARAIFRMAKEGKTGALTVFDIPFAYLSPEPAEKLREKLL